MAKITPWYYRCEITGEKLVSSWPGLKVGDKYNFEYKFYIVTEISKEIPGYCWIRNRKLTLLERIKIWLLAS